MLLLSITSVVLYKIAYIIEYWYTKSVKNDCILVLFPGIKLENNNEDVEKNYIFDIPLDFQPDACGLGNLIFNYMKKYRNNVAQYVSETGEEDTYEEVLKRCIRTALHLKSRNLNKDDVIFLCSTNQRHALVPFIASLFLTIPVASLDPALAKLDIAHLMKEVKPKILFIIPEVLGVIEASMEEAGIDAEIVIYGESDKYTDFESFLEPHEEEDGFAPVSVESLEDVAVILFSSGTTGLPKGIMLSHYGLLAQSNIVVKSDNIGRVTLTFATLYWISAVLFLIAIIEVGGARLLCKKFDPNEIWYLLDRYKVTSFFMAPSAAIAMTKAGRPEGIDTTHTWCCLIGGAAIPEKQLLELRDLLPGTFVFQGYGQSEGSGILTMFKTNDVKETLFLHNKPNSVGLPVPGIKCKVVDPDTEKICGPNEQGELRIKSRANMIGYYNRDSSESYDSDGWLRTGDIVYYDEDGCFYILDRIKEMLKYRSFHVPPAVLEQVIMSHPGVAQAVVIGIPHEEDGDHPLALIIPNELSNDNIAEEVKEYVDERVPDRMKLRGGVKVISSFPMTPSGKVRRKDLKKLVLEETLSEAM